MEQKALEKIADKMTARTHMTNQLEALRTAELDIVIDEYFAMITIPIDVNAAATIFRQKRGNKTCTTILNTNI